MTPTNPRIPDFLGIYSPKNNSTNTQLADKIQNNTQNTIFNFNEDNANSTGLNVEKNTDLEIVTKELSLKEQKAQAKAELKELKEKAKALKKEAMKKDASEEVKQAAIQAQKAVDEQALKTYKIRQAYAKSIETFNKKTTTNIQKKETDKTDNKEQKVSNDNKQNSENTKTNKTDNKEQTSLNNNKHNSEKAKKSILSDTLNNLKKQLERQVENGLNKNQNELQKQTYSQTNNHPQTVKNYTDANQNMTFLEQEGEVCDEVSNYYENIKHKKETNNTSDKNGKITIHDKETCEAFDKASKNEMKGAFIVEKSPNKQTCDVDFDANKSNKIHDINNNSFIDDIVDFFSDEEKLDYSTVDSKLGEYYQGIGDCYLLSAIRDSQVDLHKLISSKNNNNTPPYEVTFPTQNDNLKPYAKQIVTAEDLEKNKFSKGDIEVRIIEIALNKAIGKQLTNQIAELSKNTNDKTALRNSVRKALVNVDEKDQSNKLAFIEGGIVSNTKEILTGTKRKNVNLSEENKKDIEEQIKNGSLTSISIIKTDSIKLGLFDSSKMITGHSYSIKDVKTNSKGETTFTIYSNWKPSGLFGSYDSLETKEDVSLDDLMKYKQNILLQ